MPVRRKGMPNARPRKGGDGKAGKCRRAHILLAEDAQTMRALICAVLERDGHQVTECSSGRELFAALKPLLRHGQPVDFDLVVSDVRMPGYSGLEILARVSRCSKAPAFILITAFGNAEIHERARELGALAVIDKPFELETLSACVRQHLKRRATAP